MSGRKVPCKCAVCAVVRHSVYATAPSTEPDPHAMEPGDCQRALIKIWDALQKQEDES